MLRSLTALVVATAALHPAPARAAPADPSGHTRAGVAGDEGADSAGKDDSWGGAEAPRYPHPASVPMVLPEDGPPQGPPANEPPRERHRLVWDNLTAGRLNPLGAVNRFNVGYRLQLFDAPGVLFEKSFAALKLTTELAPTFGKIGGRLEVQPLAILNLAVQQEFVGSFGTFGHIQSFDSLAVDFSDTARSDDERYETYTGLGDATTLSALFQVMAFSVALRSGLKAHRMRTELRDGDTLFYNPSLDILHPNGGWAISNNLDLIVVSDFGLKLGARYTVTHGFYSDEVSGGVDRSELTPTHRVGPAILYTFFEDPPGAGWNAPTVGVLAQWWAKHPYRTGQDTGAGIPYLLVLFTQRGDFAP